MKVFMLAALVASLAAGSAMAASAHDYRRFGVNPDELSPSQLAAVNNAISSNRSHNQIQSIINGIIRGPVQQGF